MGIKLLVVDDSAFMRRIINDIVEQIDGVEIVGIARNGLEALEKIPKLNPDVITLDVEMPKLNGIETLKKIRENWKIPVIMLSSYTGTDITIEALQIGAYDFIEKPSDLNSNASNFKQEFEIKLKSIFGKKHIKNNGNPSKCTHKDCNAIKAVVIGASTGGPKALVYLISRLPNKIKVPIFIVQHMPKSFTTSLANRMNNESKIKVVEAEDGMLVENNTVYLAPGDFHMTIEKDRISLNTRDKIHGVRPAVDYLFNTAAKIYKENLLGIILTGMGKDGSEGMRTIKEFCGYNIAQSEETCVVYGMPGSAVSKGVVDEILDLENISNKLNKFIEVKI
ncbi:chemotaxis response regulator protein-glutamate methylesterase [Tissierella sp. Yu-01]|uniref:protein-glutamate methylesterase/protein-glutamine glutaminase n=1 Tax=Tissierella sp. Yu-01 TaxID=3035694 RepID=UPI00240D31CE|nr:chemotaxis response regulator protein-glutamate methylesterase [Tissierella sp. Yu-01]WFA07936.1 chemotaxis response regulator protein-glutamate methylesterase [Tissierella sp. Yu-01]